MKQLRNMGRVMRKNCQPKNNLEDGELCIYEVIINIMSKSSN